MCVETHHACALEINQIGILILGPSGSGKTSLMMGLLERAKLENHENFLISDDQTILSSNKQTLEASVPQTIAGLVEIRGYGIIPHKNKAKTNLKLVVDLVEDEAIERMPEKHFFDYEETTLPLLKVPKRHEAQAVRIVFAWLNENADLQLA